MQKEVEAVMEGELEELDEERSRRRSREEWEKGGRRSVRLCKHY